jgi:hypothetical protein
MLLTSSRSVALLVCVVLAGLCAALPADEKKDDKDKPGLSGVWVQKSGELKIEFSGKDVMKVYPHGDNEVIVVVCKYTVYKDGVVKAKVTELGGKEDAKKQAAQQVPPGLEFSFKWKVKDDAATLADVTGEKADALKSHLEGDYKKK